MHVSIRNNKHGRTAQSNQSEGENKYIRINQNVNFLPSSVVFMFFEPFLFIYSFEWRARAAHSTVKQNAHSLTIETGVKPNENEMERNNAWHHRPPMPLPKSNCPFE